MEVNNLNTNRRAQIGNITIPLLKGEQGYSISRIVRTSGDGGAGTIDTYTVYIDTDPETAIGTFQVVNGTGGDMSKNVYDIDNDDIVDRATGDGNGNEITATYETIENVTALASRVATLEQAGYITKSVADLANYYLKSETYTKQEVNNLCDMIPKFAIEVVSVLPTQDISETTIYLLRDDEETQDIYQEYIYVNNTWERIGGQRIDLSNYYQKSEVDNLLNDKADTSDLDSYYTKNSVDGLLNQKINTNDIIDNLTSTNNTKVLSAKQGKALKDLLDINNNNISTESTERANADNLLQNQITSLASGSPLVASSISEMTDTTRTYVNTSDGDWYYYNGSSWVSGGTYQSSGIAGNSINAQMTTFYDIQNFIPMSNWFTGKVWFATDGHLGAFNSGNCSYNTQEVSVTPGDVFIVYNYSEATQVKFSYWNNENTYLSTANINDKSITILTIPNNASYGKFSVYKKAIPYLPNQLFMYKLSDYMNLQNDKYATIKKEYYNDLNTDDILIPNSKVKFFPRIYGYLQPTSYSINIDNNKFILNSIYTNLTNTQYTGPYFKMQNVNVGDKLYVRTSAPRLSMYKTNIATDQIITNMPLWSYDFSTSTVGTITVTQDMIDWLNANITNAFCITRSVPAGTTNFNLEVEFLTEKGRTLTDFINDYVNTEDSLSCIVLGDSITALTGDRSWLTYFNEIQPINIIQNVAVNGAHLTDYDDTIYDGNPVFNGADNNHNNVLGNQVQKILNNNYNAPDIIMIAIGTNDGITCTEDDIYDSYYNNQGTLISLSNVDRTTPQGAFRYCNETLKNKYPNATIFWCSPIQAVNSIRNVKNVISWGKNLNLLTNYGSAQFINTENCGITGVNEVAESNGLYLQDGLHPNANGAKYMGYYNATKVKEYADMCKLNNP